MRLSRLPSKASFNAATAHDPWMPKAYIYSRMSTPEQRKGDSARRQLDSALEFAKQEGLEPEYITDHGISAFRGANAQIGQLADFLDRVKAHEIPPGSYFIVESLDRLTRDTLSRAVPLLLDIVNAGVIVYTLFDRQKYSAETLQNNSLTLMMALFPLITAQEESAKKSKRLSAVWKAKKSNSRKHAHIATSVIPAWLQVNTDRNAIEPIEARAKVVREIFQLACSGWGAQSTARVLNERNEPVWSPSRNKTKAWHDSYIQKILTSRAVIGEYQPHRNVHDENGRKRREPEGPAIEGYYPAVVSLADFEAAAQARQLRRIGGRGRKGRTYANLFTGVMRCSCGAGMQYMDKGPPPKGGRYLRCTAALAGKCSAGSLKYSAVEELLLRNLAGLDVETALGLERSVAKAVDLTKQLEEASATRKDRQRQTDQLLDVGGADDTPTPRALKARLASLEEEIDTLDATIRQLTEQITHLRRADPIGQKMLIEQLIGQARTTEDSDAEPVRRRLAAEIQKIVRRITFRRESVDVLDESGDLSAIQDAQRITVQYRSGMSQMLDLTEGELIRLPMSVQHRKMLDKRTALDQ